MSPTPMEGGGAEELVWSIINRARYIYYFTWSMKISRRVAIELVRDKKKRGQLRRANLDIAEPLSHFLFLRNREFRWGKQASIHSLRRNNKGHVSALDQGRTSAILGCLADLGPYAMFLHNNGWAGWLDLKTLLCDKLTPLQPMILSNLTVQSYLR